tara:strand:- start:1311 stop:2513 length:1203 start_codon:yes stop_codon:yes gene_type:complete
MYESSRLKPIQASPAMAISVKAQEMCKAGMNVINLSVGEPGFDTPSHIIDAAVAAMRSGETHYTPADGTIALKNAIVDKFLRENSLKFSRHNISTGNGAKQVIFNALMATMEPEDEVIVPAPYWVSYTDMVLLLGGVPKILECPVESGYKLNINQLEAAITPKTRWLILNSPSNPSGMAYTLEELRKLGNVLKRHKGVLVLSDEIYEHINYGSERIPSILNACPELHDRVVIVNGVSKAYAMTGWRLGYAAGPEKLIKVMAKIQSQSTSNPCSISQAAAIAALNGPQDFLASAMTEYSQRREVLFDALDNIPGLHARKPNGAFYAFVECSNIIGRKTAEGITIYDDEALASYFLEEAHVAVVPGSAFGLSPYFRMSFAAPLNELKEACKRLDNAISHLVL